MAHAPRRTRAQLASDSTFRRGHTVAPAGRGSRGGLGYGSQQYGSQGYGSRRRPHQGRRRGHLGRRIAVFVAVIAAVLVGSVAAFALWATVTVDSEVKVDDAALSSVLTTSDSYGTVADVEYILLLGSDSRTDDASDGRSDSMILARVDTVNNKVSLLTIPRDLKVTISGYGTQKINAAYSLGGAAGAVTAVENLTGVSISHVVIVDFSGLETIVDALGGVTVNVPEGTSLDGVTLPSGEQTLTGEEALVFARDRYTYAEGDFQRGKNQRDLITAIGEKVMSSPLTSIPALVTSLAGSVKSDMGTSQMIALALSLEGIDPSTDVYSTMVPVTTGTISGVSYDLLVDSEWKQVLAAYVAGDDPNAGRTTTAAGNSVSG